ncbi:hypothetical protein GGI21_001781 [Coemansia aciculifera]|nr:hypothetical protein GGI21_001781 [Coemansia aciculifera]
MPLGIDTNKIGPSFESLLLFVAHHVKAYVSTHASFKNLKPKDCRLILPIINSDLDVSEDTGDLEDLSYLDDEYSNNVDDVNNPNDIAQATFGMFSLNNGVERQRPPASQHIFANAAISSRDDDNEAKDDAELQLAYDTKALYFSQHNRRFAWDLTVCDCTVRAYVYGPDTVWTSTGMDVTTAAGRQTLISLLVDWSLCSVDRLGFDPSIRYASEDISGRPYLEIDVHEKDQITGVVATRTYFSNRCTVAADGPIGRHTRHFAASASIEAMNDPAVLIKDVWLPLNSDGSGVINDEKAILNDLHATFDGDSEFEDKFPQLLSTGPVYLCHGDKVVEDTTATAFAALLASSDDASAASGSDVAATSGSDSRSSLSRQHTRTVMKWAGEMISMADNQSQVVVAITDAMSALIAAYDKCNIIRSNISDRAILFRKTADGGVKRVLAEFDSAIDASDSASAANRDKPEQILFRSIRSLENAAVPLTFLDAFESLTYVIFCLGFYSVTKAERAIPRKAVAIEWWSMGRTIDMAREKRSTMDNTVSLESFIYRDMCPGLLRDVARALYKALFHYPRCPGGFKKRDGCDPLELRNDCVRQIVGGLKKVLKRHNAIARDIIAHKTTDREALDMSPPSAGQQLKRNKGKTPEYVSAKRFKSH